MTATLTTDDKTMALWKDGGFVADDWQIVDDEAQVSSDDPTFVSLARWEAERETLSTRNAPIGLVLQPDSDLSGVEGDLSRFSAIAVVMPKFADGRAFSIARLLRDRYGFTGEIRAIGDYFLDQVPFMRRVGIDAFQTEDPILIKALEEGQWPEVTDYLQPAIGDKPVPGETRPWVRRRG